jgi:ribosome-associated protein
MPIQVTPQIVIDESELELSYILASGPGGQNVNKVATAAQLRFDARHSPALSPAVRARLARIAGQRMTRAGEIIITARRQRSRERNRAEAIERLVTLLRRAAEPPKTRIATRPTRASITRRLEAKRQQSRRKRARGRVRGEE